MLSLRSRQNGYRLLLPKNFICEELQEKYTDILREKHSFFMTPIDFINETIQQVEILGFNDATVSQQQTKTGKPMIRQERIRQNEFQYPSTDFNYRKDVSPLSLVDRTLNIQFRHTIGYLNYFMLFENFWYLYSRDRTYDEMCHEFSIDLLNENGVIYSRIVVQDPMMNAMDMLSFDFSQPIAQSQVFKIEFKYSNFDYQILDTHDILNDAMTHDNNMTGSGDVILDC